MQSNNKSKPNGKCQHHPTAWNANHLNVGRTSTMGQGQMMSTPVNYTSQIPMPPPRQVQYTGMTQFQQQPTMVSIMPNGMQMQGMGMQPKSFNAPHPVNCNCRGGQLPTFPPQPSGIPLMTLGGAEMYPIGNMNCMTPVGMNGQMSMFGSNYLPQSYIEPGMYVDPAQWKEICKQQNMSSPCESGSPPTNDKANPNS